MNIELGVEVVGPLFDNIPHPIAFDHPLETITPWRPSSAKTRSGKLQVWGITPSRCQDLNTNNDAVLNAKHSPKSISTQTSVN